MTRTAKRLAVTMGVIAVTAAVAVAGTVTTETGKRLRAKRASGH